MPNLSRSKLTLVDVRNALEDLTIRISASDAVLDTGKRQYTINRNRKPSLLKIKSLLALIGTVSDLQARDFMRLLNLDRSAWAHNRMSADNMNLIRISGTRSKARYSLTTKGKNLLKSLTTS